MRIDFRDGSTDLQKRDMFVVPRGFEHNPYAWDDVRTLPIEPGGGVNTGNGGGGGDNAIPDRATGRDHENRADREIFR